MQSRGERGHAGLGVRNEQRSPLGERFGDERRLVSSGASAASRTRRIPRVARERVEATVAERERFAAALAAAGWLPLPSVTNFLLVEFASAVAADAAAEGLLSRGLIPRTFPAGHAFAHCLRLTVRNRAQDDRVVAAAQEIARA